MENSEDLFVELKIKQKDKVSDCSPVDVEENPAEDLFLAADERLNTILQEKSSVRIKIEVEEPDLEELGAEVKSTVTKLGNTSLRSIAVKSEVVELAQNSLAENETETFANEDIFKYINDEENKQNETKLFH